MPSDEAWVSFDLWRSQKTEQAFREIDTLLDEMTGQPGLDEHRSSRIRELMRYLRDLEKAKPPAWPPPPREPE